MIKKLQHRFIAIAMLSIFLVLFLIIGSINVINYSNIRHSLDMRLTILADNGGVFPQDFMKPDNFQKPEDKPSDAPKETPDAGMPDFDAAVSPKDLLLHGISAESAFDTRYFTVTLDVSGNVITASTDKIAAISSEDAISYASSLFSTGSTSGYIDNYRYTTVTSDTDGSTMYLFLDCRRELDTFRSFLTASVLICLLGLFLFFLLVVFFSRLIVRPIAESYEKQKHFITDASHEIKTPLTIIDANTEVLEMENGENEWTASIRNQIRRLTDLTNKLVFLSRMDEEGTRLTMLDFSLSDAVSETAQPFEAVAAATGRTFSYEVEPNISYTGDETTIRQLVSLLLDNAMKYSSEGGDVRLCLAAYGKSRMLTVRNTVDDIEPGRHDELFERFYRPDASRNSATGGHGIGLSVAKAIVLAHKGKITAKSDDRTSILFTVTL